MIGHIFIYGGIGEEPGEVSVKNVQEQIAQYPQATEFDLHIISGGGDVFQGYGIYNLIKNTGKKITTKVEGLCASIATLIAFAGEKIIMNKTSEFMIHNPAISGLEGDSKDIRNVADQLDKIKTLLIDVSGQRAARNGKPITKEKLWQLYDNETWLTAHETKEDFGFADEVVDAMKAVAKVNIPKQKDEMEQSEIKKMFAKFTNLFKSLRYKNQVSDTIQGGANDGKVVMIMAEGENWVGAQVMLEDGTPIEAGEYTLASGKTITVDANYVITAVGEAAPANDEPQDTDMQNRIKELEAQLAEANAKNQAASAQVVQAEAKTAKFENRLKNMEQDFIKLKEATEKTIGDTSAVDLGDGVKDLNKKSDPMGDFALNHFKNLNVI